MRLLQFKYFQTVATFGKISAAAEALHISPPALSATIARLENELGVKLFDRTNNCLFLNDQGKIFLRYVNQVFTSLEATRREMRTSLENGPTNIQVAVTASNLWIELLSAFSQKYPQITLSTTTITIPQLTSTDFLHDYTFLMADSHDFSAENLDSLILFEDYPMVMLNCEHPLAKKNVLMLSDLEEQTMFLPMANHSFNKRIKEMFSVKGVPLLHAHECSISACRTMVMENRGISFSTQRTSRNNSYNLRYLPIEDVHCEWTQKLYWHKERKQTEKEAIFKAFITEFYNG